MDHDNAAINPHSSTGLLEHQLIRMHARSVGNGKFPTWMTSTAKRLVLGIPLRMLVSNSPYAYMLERKQNRLPKELASCVSH